MPVTPPATTGPLPRAKAHDGSARLPRRPTALALVLLVACAPQDGAGPSADGDPAGQPAERIGELIAAYEPVPLEATSDKHDAALRRRRELLEQLRGGDRELGLAALAAFRAQADAADDLREALLEIAATCNPRDMAPTLERMVVTYDAQLGLGLRTRAAELLAQTSPQIALEQIGPLLVAERPDVTLPPREKLVRAWAAAARRVGHDDLGVLVDVAIDIGQPPDARGAAVDELGTFGGELPRKALEEVLFEGTSDAMLRRKAAQALAAFLPPAELCPILERAGSHEHDAVFAQFLASMMARYCP